MRNPDKAASSDKAVSSRAEIAAPLVALRRGDAVKGQVACTSEGGVNADETLSDFVPRTGKDRTAGLVTSNAVEAARRWLVPNLGEAAALVGLCTDEAEIGRVGSIRADGVSRSVRRKSNEARNRRVAWERKDGPNGPVGLRIDEPAHEPFDLKGDDGRKRGDGARQ